MNRLNSRHWVLFSTAFWMLFWAVPLLLMTRELGFTGIVGIWAGLGGMILGTTVVKPATVLQNTRHIIWVMWVNTVFWFVWGLLLLTLITVAVFSEAGKQYGAATDSTVIILVLIIWPTIIFVPGSVGALGGLIFVRISKQIFK